MKSGFAKFTFFLLALFMVGCAPAAGDSATSAPTFSLPSVTQTPPPATALPVVVGENTEEAEAVPEAATQGVVGPSLPSDAAVILVSENDTLNLRKGPGIENGVITELAADATGLFRTGVSAFSGEDLWAEVRMSTGETGWVNARFLTEYVSPERFCADPKIQALFDDLLVSLQNKNGELFSSLVSPAHGLDLRYFRYGTLANYTPEEAAWVFQSSYEVSWGYAGGSGEEVSGTFNEVPLPRMLDVFGSTYELQCNDVGVTSAFAQEPWPPEYKNINFYNVFKPGTDRYGGLDWRSWLVGIEYVGGKPYLFSMINFEWEP